MGGAGQQRLLGASLLLHGHAPICATYLAAAGLGRLLVTGAPPEIASRDPSFRMDCVGTGEPADLVLDLGDGTAFRAAAAARLWGGVVGGRVLLGDEPREGARGTTPVLETLAAAEALRRLLGLPPHRYEFSG